jgi:hypothetical protein
MKMIKYSTVIGIDPAFRDNGFCLCDIKGDEVSFSNYKLGFLDFMEDIKSVHAGVYSKTIIAIENSNLQNTNFDTTGSRGVISRKGRNVGSNQAISQLVVDFCKRHTQSKILNLSPQRKGKKWNQAQFEAIVKQERHRIIQNKKGNNQDERDAYKLALIALKELKRLNNCK